MAGDLLIRSLHWTDLEDIKRNGGRIVEKIFHSDQDSENNFAILFRKLANQQEPNSRVGLPPHCYIEFHAKELKKQNAYSISSAIRRLERPLSIVKTKAGLDGWNGASDLDRAHMLTEENQKGPISFELYFINESYGFKSIDRTVKRYFTNYEMIPQ